MPTKSLAILEHAAMIADVTRCRLLQILDRQELTVSELCTVLQLPQSTVSRHLKLLAGGGWVRSRREATSHYYQFARDLLENGARKLWKLVREQAADAAVHGEDLRRLESVLAARRSRSQEFFSATAEQWDRLRDDLFGPRLDLLALPGLLDPTWVLGDLGCGTGRVTLAVAPFVARVVAVDASRAMLAAARARLAHLENVEIKPGSLESLPLADNALDAATLFLALHHVPDPARALAEARRVLRPGGRLLVVDMMPHDRQEYRQQMGHVWLGFAPDQLVRQLETAGFAAPHHHVLPPDPLARGPALFAASARATVEAPTRKHTRHEVKE
jgi:ArsR family transcriptional regulator